MNNTQKTTIFAVASAFLTALVQTKVLGKYEPVAIALGVVLTSVWGVYTQGTDPKNSI